MARPKLDKTLDLSNPESKARVRQFFEVAQGPYRISAEPASPRHSKEQRGYYFNECVGSLMEFLNRDNACLYTKDQCHEILATDCLPQVEVVNPETGEVIGRVRSSVSKLTKAQMSEYIDRVRAHLMDWNIPTEDPDPMWRVTREPNAMEAA